MKVLHVFDHSLPHHSGYAFRSESILQALRARGVDTYHLTSPKHVHQGQVVESFEGLEFRRCSSVIEGTSPVDQARCVRVLRRTLKDLMREVDPDVIHCHSPCLTGLAALGLGVPLVYEVRACWEDAAASSGTTTEGSVRYRATRALETFVALRADALVVICEGLRDEFIDRGLNPARMHVVGNAVNPSSIPQPEPNAVRALRESLGLANRKTLGFFGSFYEYEGLELLVESLPSVLAAIPDLVLVLAGGGESEQALRAAITRLGLEHHVKMLGRMPHEQIGNCYGMTDVMVFPRLRQRLTDMVTPLKPLEAMFLGTPVVASDVGGHRELVRDGVTGLLFRAGDPEDLSRALVRALAEPSLASGLAANARQYVGCERLWTHMAQRYQVIYQSLVSPGRGR